MSYRNLQLTSPGKIWDGFPEGVILESRFEDVCNGLNCAHSPNLHVEALTLNVTALGNRTLKDIIKVK